MRDLLSKYMSIQNFSKNTSSSSLVSKRTMTIGRRWLLEALLLPPSTNKSSFRAAPLRSTVRQISYFQGTMKFLPAATASSLAASSLLITVGNKSNFFPAVAAFIAPASSRSSSNISKQEGGSASISLSSFSTSTSARYSAVAPQDDVAIAQQLQEQKRQSTFSPNDNKGGGLLANNVLTGEILSLLYSSSNNKKNRRGEKAFAVVKVSDGEDIIIPSTKTAVAAAVKQAASSMGPTNNGEDEEEKVELASALFGKPMPMAVKKLTASAPNGGVIADGDLTGRTVTFANNANNKGMVVAHRHPVAFVLLENSVGDDNIKVGDDEGGSSTSTTCSILPNLVSVDPSAIPPGSIVDYLGNSLAVLNDGSVSRSLPKAAVSPSAAVAVDLENGVGIGGVSLTVSNSFSNGANGIIGTTTTNTRPIFVPIPKISDIGLIDSPLVSGITAVDALTPIGKGQNMLVIGDADDDNKVAVATTAGTTNKRGWMINFLRNVIENNRRNDEGKRSKMRCYYGLTYGNNKVRSNLLERLKEAGIQDDVVTVLSTRHLDIDNAEDDTEKAITAAEAVAVAATACSLGEHHALTTGGDSLVFIDDINLHKSLWDVTTQYLVKVYGVDAVVEADLQGGSSSEMRGYFSGLIQRAARFNVKKGGGSVTLILLSTLPGDKDQDVNSNGEDEEPTFDASDFDNMSEKIKTRISMLVKAKVPLTPTNLKKIQIPLPRTSDAENAKRLALQHVEDLISMSDGQIWLDNALAKTGRSPPLDPSRSITRVGVGADTVSCRADAPALRSVVGSLRFEFQQAMDVMESKSSSPNTTAAAIVGNKKQVQRRDAFLLAMHQESNQKRMLSHECIALIAASRGHLDAVLAKGGMAGTAQGKEAIDGLLEFVANNASGVVTEIDDTLDMSSEGKNVLVDLIASYFAKGN